MNHTIRIALFAFIAYVLYKHYVNSQPSRIQWGSTIFGNQPSPFIDKAGIPTYDPTATSQSMQQIYAGNSSNGLSLAPLGYYPAFGPNENRNGLSALYA